MKELILIGLCILLFGCNSSLPNSAYAEGVVEPPEYNFPCAEGRECIDICNGSLLVMQFGECEMGCTTYKGKLVGAYELQFALESCEENN